MRQAKKIVPIVLLIAIATFCACFFSACIDADYSKVAEKLGSEKYGYAVSYYEDPDIGCTHYIKAAKGQDGDRSDFEIVYVIYFDDIDSAIKYYETELAESLERLKEDPLYIYLDEPTSERVGNIVLYGTSGGIKDALS